MKLAEINTLAELDRTELIAVALEHGVILSPDVAAKSFPTSDALRIAIIEKVVEKEVRPIGKATAQSAGADHLAEAIVVHAHGVELHREGLKLLDSEAIPQRMLGERKVKEADAHFSAARSAAAIAQAGLTAALLGAVGEVMESIA